MEERFLAIVLYFNFRMIPRLCGVVDKLQSMFSLFVSYNLNSYVLILSEILCQLCFVAIVESEMKELSLAVTGIVSYISECNPVVNFVD